MRPILFSAFFLFGLAHLAPAESPNVLIVTVDDMSCDSVGAFGCDLAGTTPHIDRLAAEGLRYHYAHVQVGNCYPSRNVMFSGRYPHNTGVEGFYQVRETKYPHLVDLMKDAGYFVAIRGKVSHSTPYQPYAWDADLTTLDGKRQHVKSIESYYRSTQKGIELAAAADKPFCINVNISDPHKPFYAMGKGGEIVEDENLPSRVFVPEEVPVPGFLFDHPSVRLELAHYYSSVRRADDCFGAVMRALKESGQEGNTVVIFLSDHGMPLPFAKTALWHHSTRTPWVVRWPGVTKPGSIDKSHMVSAVDLLPTLLDIVGVEAPKGFDGRSFAPTLRGESQSDREMVFKVYNENSGSVRNPMRSVESKRFGYLFNPWVNGKRTFKTATTGTITYRTMQRLAPENETIAARLKHFQFGALEEFYDYENDPDALNNLIDDPTFASEVERHRAALRRFMESTGDHALEPFDQRGDPVALDAYMNRVQGEADARRAAKKRSQMKSKKPRPNPKLFTLELPKQAEAGKPFRITVRHALPASMGEQAFHVTLKDAAGKRIKRIVKQAEGSGTLVVEFQVPQRNLTPALRVSAFVGKDYTSNLLHRSAGPVRIGESKR
ncbi:MAG: sulfatase [Planctomycetota bacterium]